MSKYIQTISFDNSTSWYYLRDRLISIYKEAGRRMSIASLLIRMKNWKQPICLSKNEYINWHSYIKILYSSYNEVDLCVSISMTLDNLISSEKKQFARRDLAYGAIDVKC